MAAIDKTYLADYSVYQDFLNWAKKTTYTCPNGLKFRVYDYVYPDCPKEAMDKGPCPILNSPQSLDYFLIKYCPFTFIQERMEEVYDKEYIDSVRNGTSEYDTFKYPEISTHFKIVKRGYAFKSKNYLWKLYFRVHCKQYFWIRATLGDSYLYYNKYINRFILPEELGYWTCSSAYKTKTIKALIRSLRKMKIPKGAIIEANGRYDGEKLTIIAK
jgi:hypothetical protein